jgi:SnoaL-like domain
MDTHAAARAWAAGWTQAWTTHDPELLVSLYEDDADFRSSAFRDPLHGGDGVHGYATWAFADEEHAKVRFAEPFQASDGRAVVEWWAIVSRGDHEETIAGVSLLQFSPEGRVQAQRDYWELAQGQLNAHDGAWGS